MTSNSEYDRPETYWPESRNPEQLLARIKGEGTARHGKEDPP